MNLHKYADGILGGFNLKTTGKPPDQFSDAIQGTAELLDFYLRDFLTIPAAVPGAATNPGDGVVVTVPDGLMWRVLQIGIAVFPNAADAAIPPYGRFDFRTESGATLAYIAATQMPAAGALYTNLIAAHMFSVPLLLKAGSVIGWRSETQFTAAALLSLNVTVQAIPL